MKIPPIRKDLDLPDADDDGYSDPWYGSWAMALIRFDRRVVGVSSGVTAVVMVVPLCADLLVLAGGGGCGTPDMWLWFA